MPLIWSELRQSPWRDALMQVQLRCYQASTYVALSLVDDPAWLALVFC